MLAKKTTAKIEVFRPGTFTPMNGEPITYSAADLKAAADAYNAETAPAPIVVGHPTTDAPAFGWAESFEFDATSQRLYANVGEIDPAFAEAVRAGRYKKVSLSFHRPNASANPVPGAWYPKHIGFLGGAAPAVSGLRNVSFSADADAPVFTAEFGERGFEESASLLRGLRDFLIEKFGLEDADKALPAYRIEWLSEMECDPKPINPSYASPQKKEQKVPKTDAEFAVREAELAARDAALKAREAKASHDDNVAFAETLVAGEKLLPESKDKVVAILDALGSETVAFAGSDGSVPVAEALRGVLNAQPKIISYGRTQIPPAGGKAVSFAADGHEVDTHQLEIHEKALAFQAAHPGTVYLDAVHAVS